MTHRIAAAALCAALFAGCSTSSVRGVTPDMLPGLRPAAAAPVAKGSRIKHVIVVIQENRTFDNMFNGFPNADTVSFGRDSKGNKVRLQPQGLEWYYDPSHTFKQLRTEWNNGGMNGFDKETCDFNPLGTGGSCVGIFAPPANFAYSYVPQSETTFLWILGGGFVPGIGYGIADRMFSTRMTPSFPGHQYLIAGDTPAAGDPYGPGEGGLLGIWGCDAKKKAKVTEFGASFTAPLTAGYPCYDYKTIGDLMDKKGVTWKYYTGAIGTVDGTISAFDAIKHARFGPQWTKNVVTPMTDIFNDIQNDTLPDVAFVTPPGPMSDHAGFMTSGGPAWVTSIYVWLTENKARYDDTAILVTWDDSGGWYDHVKPPTTKWGPMGFRVPLMALNPYAKNAVSHKVHSFGSILHFIEKNWNLGSLGTTDATSDDLSDMFDYSQKPIPPIVNFGSFSAAELRQKYNKAYWDRMLSDPRPVDDDR